MGAGVARRARVRMDAGHEKPVRRLRHIVRGSRRELQVRRPAAGGQRLHQRASRRADRSEPQRHAARQGTEAGDGGGHLRRAGQHGLQHAHRRLCRRRREGHGPKDRPQHDRRLRRRQRVGRSLDPRGRGDRRLFARHEERRAWRCSRPIPQSRSSPRSRRAGTPTRPAKSRRPCCNSIPISAPISASGVRRRRAPRRRSRPPAKPAQTKIYRRQRRTAGRLRPARSRAPSTSNLSYRADTQGRSDRQRGASRCCRAAKSRARSTSPTTRPRPG